MTTVIDPLCELPATPADDCCEPPTVLAAPIPKGNARGLPAIAYRIGTFTSFRRAMLDDVARKQLLADLIETGRTDLNTFEGWREGSEGDYQTGLIELWAYLADVLTFYQERIANEAFLGTATQRESAVRLAELIGHRASQGAAATALLAFTVETGRVIDLPAGLRVGAKPGPGGPPPVFEISTATTVLGAHSAIPLSSVAPTNQFAALASYGAIAGAAVNDASRARAAAEIYGALGSKYIKSITVTPQVASSMSAIAAGAAASSAAAPTGGAGGGGASTGGSASGGAVVASSQVAALADAIALRSGVSIAQLSTLATTARRRIVLVGTATGLRVGDDVLVVQNEGRPGMATTLRRVASVVADPRAGTTTIGWDEPIGASYSNVSLYALRVKAAAFGSSAPAWATLPAALTRPSVVSTPVTTASGTTIQIDPIQPPYPTNWDDPTSARAYLPSGRTIRLDATYDAIRATPTSPSWVVLLGANPAPGTSPPTTRTPDGRAFMALRLTGASPGSEVDYALTARVTRLAVSSSSSSIPEKTFPIRTATILAGAEQLIVQPTLPLPERMTGTTFLLDGLYPDLRAGQLVILRGRRFDPIAGGPARTTVAETGVLAKPPELDRDNSLTQVTLKKAVGQAYARSTTRLLANVVEATHGETVRDEVLGSGDGSAGQVFTLKKAPLTYVPAGSAESVEATTSTLRVTVDGVTWRERRNLVGAAPNEQTYMTREDETSGKTSVTFGDGVEGARPSTARDNIRARYRRGLGSTGNVKVDALSQLVDNVAGLQRSTNPLPATGGVDPETATQLKTTAPIGVRTFGRAVSTEDYAALALAFPGIAKASAIWVRRDPRTYRAVERPWIQLTVAGAEGEPPDAILKAAVRKFLDSRRDPNVALRVDSFIPVYVEVVATVDVDDRYGRQATLARVMSAMRPGVGADGQPGFFAFQRQGFGVGLHLATVSAAVQAVEGVRSAHVRVLRRVGPAPVDPPGSVRNSIFVRPNEIAVIRDDPEDPGRGRLVIELGEGGFSDA